MNAREMFKELEKVFPGMKTARGCERVEQYGKIDKATAFIMVRKTKWIYNSPPIYIDVIKKNDNGECEVVAHKLFDDEKEFTGGGYIGKMYKNAIEYAHEYIQGLKQQAA